jgi:uncharacterized protein YjbJ (UPF0337 family)
MSSLPITNNETPLLIPSEVNPIQSEAPDLSNPYMYPANPEAPTAAGQINDENIPLNDENLRTSFNSSGEGDPELQKIKSSFWKKAGKLQSAIGSMAGLETWQTSGEKAKEEAEREYQEAENRLNQGEASRIHGEFDRLMGYVTYAVGHVAGDTEMQAKANQRTQKGESEINKSTN